MKKLLFCAPVKFEHLLFWSRNQPERDDTDVRWQVQEKDEDQGIIVVELIKGKNQSLGLTISGGTDKQTCPVVANIRSGGLADKSDYFCVGEPILEINEKDITKLKHGEIIRFIQDSGKRLRFKMAYKKVFDNDKSVYKTANLKIFKEDHEAKFKLRGGKSKDGAVIRPIMIAELDQKSDVARNGEILDGDIVLAINDKNVDNLHISEVKSLLKQSDEEYRLRTQFEVSQTESELSEKGSIIVELLRPNENINPGMGLDVSLEHEQLGSIIVISEIKESGIASRTGSLNVGDLVLAINNISMDGMSVDQARQIINSSAKKIQLEVISSKPKTDNNLAEPQQKPAVEKPVERDLKAFRADTLPSTRSGLKQYPSRSSLTSQRRANTQDRVVTSKTSDIAYATLRSLSYKRGTLTNARQGSFDDSRSIMSACSTLSQCNLGNMLSKPECMSVVLISDDCDFGIDVQDGLSSPDTGCIVICAIANGKAADRSGVLQVGDRIVSINGIRTDFMSYEEFLRIMHESVTSLRLEVDFDITDAIVPSSGTFTVKIPRSENTGIILAETHHDDPDRMHRVVDIRKGSVAYRLGILNPGDQVVHINGVSTNTMSLYDANEIIRKCNEVMRITVKKDEEIQGNTFAVEFDRRGKQLGITISGSDEPFGAIYITSLSDEGVAGRSGAVSVGDRLLAINEETLRGKPLWKAYSMLRTTCDIVKLLIKRTPSPVISSASKDINPDHRSCSDVASPTKDVQQWVLSSNPLANGYAKKTGNISLIREQERCQTSSNSGSTESYCDISDAADTQSTLSDIQTRPKKKPGCISRRPLLPAWQRECLKNYEGEKNVRLDEFTKSDNFSRNFEGISPQSRSYSGTISIKPSGFNALKGANCNRVIEGDVRGNSFNWKRALSSEPKEFVVYNDGGSLESGVDCAQIEDIASNDYFSYSSNHFKEKRDAGYRLSAKGGSVGGPMSTEKTRSNREIPKSNRRSPSATSRNTYGHARADSDISNSSLAISPFQFEIPSKSERYLRDLERKTEAQYNDIIEKLGKSSSERVELVEDKVTTSSFTPIKLKKIVTPITQDNELLRDESMNEDLDVRKPNFMIGDDLDGDILPEDPLPVTLHRILITKQDSDQDFGFSVSEKVDGSGIFVNSIQSEGRGRRPSKLKKYDRVLQVNGIHTRDLSCDQVVPLLQRAGRRLQLVVERVSKE